MKNILIVDDSKAVHAYIDNCFGPYNVTLTHVYNGREALDTLQKQPGHFELILLDWEMPVMDGPTTFDSLPPHSGIPVIMMTTKNLPEDISMMLNKGVQEYVLKPFTRDILVEKIEYVLGTELGHVK